jgi:hypothetical protein
MAGGQEIWGPSAKRWDGIDLISAINHQGEHARIVCLIHAPITIAQTRCRRDGARSTPRGRASGLPDDAMAGD